MKLGELLRLRNPRKTERSRKPKSLGCLQSSGSAVLRWEEMQRDEEERAVKNAAQKKGIDSGFLIAILGEYRGQIEKGKKLQFGQALEAIIEEEVGRRAQQ